MDILHKINDIYSGGNVKRHHNYPIIDRQSVAEHTWRILVMYDQLWPNSMTLETFRKAAYHDVAEYKTGDVPANAKWRSPVLAAELHRLQTEDDKRLGIDEEVSDDVFRKIKFCDRLEHMMFCLEQRRLGNRNVDRPFGKLVTVVKDTYAELLYSKDDPSFILFKDIIDQWNKQIAISYHVGGQHE